MPLKIELFAPPSSEEPDSQALGLDGANTSPLGFGPVIPEELAPGASYRIPLSEDAIMAGCIEGDKRSALGGCFSALKLGQTLTPYPVDPTMAVLEHGDSLEYALRVGDGGPNWTLRFTHVEARKQIEEVLPGTLNKAQNSILASFYGDLLSYLSRTRLPLRLHPVFVQGVFLRETYPRKFANVADEGAFERNFRGICARHRLDLNEHVRVYQEIVTFSQKWSESPPVNKTWD